MAGLVFGLLGVRDTEPILHDDSIRDLLLARDCADGRAHFGALASIGYYQHAGWTHLLGQLLALGVPISALPWALVASNAAAAGFVAALGGRLGSMVAGVGAALLCASLTVIVTDHPTLWNPGPAGIGAAISTLGLACIGSAEAAQKSAWGAACLVGVGLALSAEAQLVNWLSLPLVLGAVTAVARRPLRDSCLALGTFVLIVGGLSGNVVVENLRLAASNYGIGLCVMGASLLLFGGSAVGAGLRRFAPTAPRVRAWLAMAAPMGLFAVVLVVGSAATEKPLFPRYFAAALPAGALSAALLVSWADRRVSPRRLPILASIGLAHIVHMMVPSLYAPGADPGGVRTPLYTVPDVERLTSLLSRSGMNLGDRIVDLRGPRASWVAWGSAIFEERPNLVPGPIRRSVRLLRFDQDDAPESIPGWTRVQLGDGDSAFVGPIQTWLPADEFSLCGGPAKPMGFRAIDPAAFAQLGFATLSNGGEESCPRGGAPPEARWGIHVPADDRVRYIELTPVESPPCSDCWRIVRVEGLTAFVSADGQCARIGPVAPGARGTLVLAPPVGATSYGHPSVLETRPDEAELRAWLGSSTSEGRSSCDPQASSRTTESHSARGRAMPSTRGSGHD